MPFELSLSPEEIAVQAGQTEELTVTVRNLGPEEQEYTVEVLGLDSSVYRLPQTSLRVAPEAAGELRIVLCPPAGGNIRTATYTFRVRATTPAREQQVQTARMTLEPALAIKLDLARAGGNRFELNLSSEAATDIAVELKAEDETGADPGARCDYDLDQLMVTLRAGENLRVPLRVRPRRRPLVGGSRTARFVVSATPEIRNARGERVQGMVRTSPILPWWLIALVLLLIGVAVYFLVLPR